MIIDVLKLEKIEEFFEKRKIPDNRWIAVISLNTPAGRIFNQRERKNIGVVRGRYGSGHKLVGELCIGKSAGVWMTYTLHYRKPIIIPLNLHANRINEVFVGDPKKNSLKNLQCFEQRLQSLGFSRKTIKEKLETLLGWLKHQSTCER